MPGKRVRAERLLETALTSLAAALTESGAPWMVIGGIAIIARGVRRFTTDIDATVRGDAIQPERLVKLFARHAIVPRIDDAIAFAQANLVLLLRHRPTGVDLDISLAWSTFEHEALAACTLTEFGGVSVPMSSPEDLIVFKAIAGRPKDMDDVQTLLELYPKLDVARMQRRIAQLAVLAEAPELVPAFEATLARARTAAPKSEDAPKSKRPAAARRRKKWVKRRG